MKQSDWDELRYNGVKKTLLMSVPGYAWYDQFHPTDNYHLLNEVVDAIMEKFRLFTHKLEDEIHRSHHDG